MAFSEKIKMEAKRRAAFRCVICQKPFVEIHHIIPQHEGGSDELSNAAPLCAGCHDLYGDNPSKRKQIREMRDFWYEVVQKRLQGDLGAMFATQSQRSISTPHKGVALYHFVYRHEDFETTAEILFKLIANAQKQYPNIERHLFLDIEEHLNQNGDYDADMFELQTHFMLDFLMQYLTSVHMPLGAVENNTIQNNNIPNEFIIL